MRVFHITTRDEWQAAQKVGEYRPQAFAREGFIHCSYDRQVCGVANRLFAGREDLVLLEIELTKVPYRVVDENLEGGHELYPHVYGPLPAAAVIVAHPFTPGSFGEFTLPATTNVSRDDDRQ